MEELLTALSSCQGDIGGDLVPPHEEDPTQLPPVDFPGQQINTSGQISCPHANQINKAEILVG